MKHIETQIDLPADPSVVWQHLVDTASMGGWNPFILSRSAIGSRYESRPSGAGR